MNVVSIFIPVAIVFIAIILIVGFIAGAGRGDENMIKKVYIYLVLFATLMMTIGGGVAAFMAAADIISPNVYYQTFDEYKRYRVEKPNPEVPTDIEQPTEDELFTEYTNMANSEKDRQVQRAKNNLIKSFGWIAIPFPVFVYFQRTLTKKENFQ